MADYLVTDTELTSIANAIRTKGGTSGTLSFPTGFVNAINDIQTGGGGVDLPVFTLVYDANEQVSSLTCNKTYAECYELINDQYTTSSPYTFRYYAILNSDYTASGSSIYCNGMSGYQDYNTSGTPLKYYVQGEHGRPIWIIWLYSDETVTYSVSDIDETLTATQNKTYNAPYPKLYSQVNVNVPNTYSAGDEGKVVSNGALVSQASQTYTTNGTFDTTAINSVTVNVAGGATIGAKTITANGTYNASADSLDGYSSVMVNVLQFGTLLKTESLGTIAPSGTGAATTGKTVSVTGVYDYDLLVWDISVDTVTNSRHVRTISVMWLTASSNVNTKDGVTVLGDRLNVKASSNGVQSSRQSSTSYGIYPYNPTISAGDTGDNGKVQSEIYERYYNTQTGTINGSYTVRVYGVNFTR